MGSTTSFTYVIFSSKIISTSFPLRITYRPPLHKISNSKILSQRAHISRLLYSYGAPFSYSSSRNKVPLPVECGAEGFRSGEDDHRAVETVLKLYAAIKNKNFNELSDIIGEECLCISNFVSTSQIFRGRERVLAFFSSLMKNLGNNLEFVVQTTFQDGMTVRVSWKLEWKKTGFPLGKGFSFHMCHIYQGKVMIKNMEMFLEPLLHIEPLKLETTISLASVMDELSCRIFKFKTNGAAKILFALLLVVALFFFSRKFF